MKMIIYGLFHMLPLVLGANECCNVKEVREGPYKGEYKLKKEGIVDQRCMDSCVYTFKEKDVCFGHNSNDPVLNVQCNDGLYSKHNINVAEKCCFIIRSPRDETYILTDPFAVDCSGGCAYKPYGSYGKSVCLDNIRNPTCCSYSTGALCQLYENRRRFSYNFRQNEKNIAERGTCSTKCQEIANYAEDPSNDWFKNEIIHPYSRKPSSFQTAVNGPEPVEQSAKVCPRALKSARFKRSGGDCSGPCWFWIFTCYMADCYCQFKIEVNWYSMNGYDHYFKHGCCAVFQPHCPSLPACPST